MSYRSAGALLRNTFRMRKLFSMKEPPVLSAASAEILEVYERQWALNKELPGHNRVVKKLQQELTELALLCGRRWRSYAATFTEPFASLKKCVMTPVTYSMRGRGRSIDYLWIRPVG